MNIAVVGASNNPEKYGYRIVKFLAEHRHTVYPVNLMEPLILGILAYRRLEDIPFLIDIVDIVVPPKVALRVIREAERLQRVHVWLQPGAESDEAIAYLTKNRNRFSAITYNDCIMTSLDTLANSAGPSNS